MSRFKRDLVESAKQHRHDEIAFLNIQLVDCTEELAKIQGMMVSCGDARERSSLERKLTLTLKKRTLLIDRLARLGQKVEQRGRPKKALGQQYQQKRSKFTAWLLPENLSYVRELKSRKEIANISDFLDRLIEEHRKKG